MLLAADFDDFTFAATHLSLDEADRLDAIDRIEAELLPSDKPVFLAGDWNAVPGDTTLRRVGRSFRLLSGTAPTFPADAPVKCIDYVAVDRAHAPLFAKARRTSWTSRRRPTTGRYSCAWNCDRKRPPAIARGGVGTPPRSRYRARSVRKGRIKAPMRAPTVLWRASEREQERATKGVA